MFVSQGYHAAAMDDIAERAGVSKPVLYQHFPGKLELYLALLDESVGTLVETVGGALRSNADPKQRVAATFGAYFEYVGGKGQAYRLVFESDLSNEPAVRERLEEVQHQCAEMVSRAVREDAGISHEEAHLLSVGLVGMAQVTARYWLSTRDHIPREAAEQLVAREPATVVRDTAVYPGSPQEAGREGPAVRATRKQQPIEQHDLWLCHSIDQSVLV